MNRNLQTKNQLINRDRNKPHEQKRNKTTRGMPHRISEMGEQKKKTESYRSSGGSAGHRSSIYRPSISHLCAFREERKTEITQAKSVDGPCQQTNQAQKRMHAEKKKQRLTEKGTSIWQTQNRRPARATDRRNSQHLGNGLISDLSIHVPMEHRTHQQKVDHAHSRSTEAQRGQTEKHRRTHT